MTLVDIIGWIGAFLVGALATGRISRALYHDAFPPSAWLRAKWDLLTEGSDWNLLLHCPWCITHWVAAVTVGWWIVGLFVPWLAIAWWVWNGWWALSYVASMIIVRDEPEE